MNNTLEQQVVVQQQVTNKLQQNDGWNKEGRNWDARISDVLGKIKERELMVNNYDEWERKCKDVEKKYEQKIGENNDLKKRLAERTNENKSLKTKALRRTKSTAKNKSSWFWRWSWTSFDE